MFPLVGSQILCEPGSPEDFQVMEVKNVSRDTVSVTRFCGIARSVRHALTCLASGGVQDGWIGFDSCAGYLRV